MEDLRNLSKNAMVDQKMRWPGYGNPDCDGLCIEAFDGPFSLRLAPMELLYKNVQWVLLCISEENRPRHTYRFRFFPIILSIRNCMAVASVDSRKSHNKIYNIICFIVCYCGREYGRIYIENRSSELRSSLPS